MLLPEPAQRAALRLARGAARGKARNANDPTPERALERPLWHYSCALSGLFLCAKRTQGSASLHPGLRSYVPSGLKKIATYSFFPQMGGDSSGARAGSASHPVPSGARAAGGTPVSQGRSPWSRRSHIPSAARAAGGTRVGHGRSPPATRFHEGTSRNEITAGSRLRVAGFHAVCVVRFCVQPEPLPVFRGAHAAELTKGLDEVWRVGEAE